MIGAALLWIAAAAATGLHGFEGEWGLDPARSDDPAPLLVALARAPVATSGAASRYSPDEGADTSEEERARSIELIRGMLGISSRVALSPDGEALGVTFGGEAPVELELGRKWKKVERDDGSSYRIRASQDGDHLVIERRIKSNVLTETFLPPTDGAADKLFVVVRLDASGLASGLEFRRAYVALHPPVPE